MAAPALLKSILYITFNDVTTDPSEDAHVWRVTNLDKEQSRILLAFGFKNKDLKFLERVEIPR